MKKTKIAIFLVLTLCVLLSMSVFTASAGCEDWETYKTSTYCATPICRQPNTPTFYVVKYMSRYCKSEYGTEYIDLSTETYAAGCC